MNRGLDTNMPVGVLLQTVASQLRCFVLIKMSVELSKCQCIKILQLCFFNCIDK